MGCGEARMVRRVGRRAEVCCDCWTLVLRRSAGWRRMADVRPEERPARKWKVVFEAVVFYVSFLLLLFRVWVNGQDAQAEVLN